MRPPTLVRAVAMSVVLVAQAPSGKAQCVPQELAEITATSGFVGDEFGTSVARSENTMVVGAPQADRAFVYELQAGAWVEVVELSATGGEFGRSVAIDADTIVVGAPQKLSGVAWVYYRNEGGSENWGNVAKLLPVNGVSGDRFGASLALEGDTLLVGSVWATRSAFHSGAVYAYDRNQGGASLWGETQEITARFPRQNGQFGTGLALQGDEAFIGQPGLYLGAASTFTGKVRLYARTAGVWNYVKVRVGSLTPAGSQFGWSVSVQGDELVVGAPFEWGGSVYVFERDAGGAGLWGETSRLRPEVGGGAFGNFVDLEDDMLAIGAPDRGNPFLSGRVYLFGRGFAGDAWGQMNKFKATSTKLKDHFGTSFDLTNGELVVGATRNEGLGLDLGATYYFDGLVEFPHGYCSPGATANGCPAHICGAGTPSASASSGFVVTATSVEGNKSGMFFFGTTGQQDSPWGNGTSLQCVVPPVQRVALLSSGGTAGSCSGTFADDLNAHWASYPAQNPGAGAVVQLQLWFRDPQNSSNQPTSLSDALQFTVGP